MLKRPRDDPDGSKKGMSEGQKKKNRVFPNDNCTRWPATQVGPRPVEPGLGGHEEDVNGVDDGVKKASVPI